MIFLMEISDLVKDVKREKNNVYVNLLKLTDPFLDSTLEEKSHKIVIAVFYAFLLTPIEIKDIEKDPRIFDKEYAEYIKSNGKKTLAIYSYDLKIFGHHLNVTFGRQDTVLSFECESEDQAKSLYKMIERRKKMAPEIILRAFQDFYPK